MPCLDMQNGRVVKGVHFVDIKDAGDPVECARAYCAGGADELALLDITATVEGRAAILLAASMFHFGMVRIDELKQYLKNRGVAVNI